MHIAYVCADRGVPVFGRKGCSVHVREVIRALMRRGATVELFAANVGGAVPKDLVHLKIHETPQADRDALSTSDFDLVYERYSLWSCGTMEAAAERGIPTVLEVNAPLIEEHVRHRAMVDVAAAMRIAHRAFNAASVVVAVSEEVAAYVRRFVGDPSRIHVVPNGVDPARFGDHVRPSHPPRSPDTFTVGFVGNARPWHGLKILINAFDIVHRRDAHTRLLLVGGGSTWDELACAFQTPLMTGPVDHDDVPGLLASMDVAVAPYSNANDHTFYFSPLKVYEYMAAGLPTVASNVGQLKDVIEHERTGLLVTPGDASAIADAIVRLLNDGELRRKLGRAAREQVARNHTWDHVAERIIHLAGASREGIVV